MDIVIVRRSMVVPAIALMLMLCVQATAYAVSWSDDFNDGSATDGNPLTWLENLGGAGPFFGSYNASSMDYVMTPAVDGVGDSTMLSLVTTPFTDVHIRTQGIVHPDPNDPGLDGGNLVVLGRIDPQTLSGYLTYFDVGGNLNIQIIVGGVSQDIGVTFDAPFNASSEVVVEMNIVGDQLSAYAWLADDPNGKPAEPQATATDSTFTAGVSGIAFKEDEDNTTATFRYVAARDTPFVDSVAGDYDDDFDVDGADFLVWQQDLGSASELAADGSGNGVVDGDDLPVWAGAFGATPPAAAAAQPAPEPASFVSALMASLVLAHSSATRRPSSQSR
jgi:hypothetical protein